MEPWEEIRIGVIGSVDSGKCFGENTLIKINKSIVKTIQDIRVGDLIISADNYNLKKVARVTTGEGILFNVKQSNGNDYLVNEYHILCLKLQILSDFNINYLKLVALYHYEDNTIDIDISNNIDINKEYNLLLEKKQQLNKIFQEIESIINKLVKYKS